MADNTDKFRDKDQKETPELEHKVDLMMDPKLPDGPNGTSEAEQAQGAPTLPEIDIFKDAPEAITSAVTEEVTDTAETEPSAEATEKIPEDPAVQAVTEDPVVDEIVAHEGDELLAADDAQIAKAFISPEPTHGGGIRGFFKAWWGNRTARYGTLAVIVLGIAVTGTMPTSRYFVLNSSGVRVASSLTVLDKTNDLPLKNVSVSLQGKTIKTNDDGVAHLTDLKLGKTTVIISRLGFAQVQQTVILGLGSNPLNDVSLRAIGQQYKFSLTDYLSGKPVLNAEVSQGDGEAAAQTDNHGQAILTIGASDPSDFDALITATGYRSEKVSIKTGSPATFAVNMVASHQTVFVSKQSGKYDVYKSDIDGKNRRVLLAASGLENDQISLVQDPTAQKAALVSRRDNLQNKDGYNLQALTIIDVSNGSSLLLDHSEQIQLIGWQDGKLIYVKIKAGTSAGNPERYQLYSYDVDSTVKLLLASANYFSDIVMAKGSVYYAASNNFQGGVSQFVRIGADNTGKQVLLNQEVFTIMRSNYDTLYLSANPSPTWFSFHIGDSTANKLSAQPADAATSKFYLDAVDGKRALWTDVRDGKGVLLVYDANTKQDTKLATASGLTYPLRWLDSRTVMYRVVTPQESADYAVSLDGGAPKKVGDVTNTSGLGKWFYY